MTRPPLLVLALAGAFLLLVTSLLIGSFTKPEFPPYRVGPTGDSLYTLDASRGDGWRRFHFASHAAVDSGPWDIAFRRNHVITAPGAGAIDLGPVSFDSVELVPSGGYAETTFQGGGDSTNPAIGKWYSYSMLSHLLTTKHHVYAVRTADGGFVKVEFLAYYCREVGAACYTMRYKTARPRATESPGALHSWTERLLGRQNLEHPGPAHGTDTL